jgi:ferric enterobactin receptor
MKLTLLTSLLALLTLPTFAQFGGFGGGAAPKALPGTAGDNSPKGTAKITGIIADSVQGRGVEFASVALYNRTTGKAVDGTVADEKGKFTLAKLVAGNYKLLVTFVGYKNQTLDSLTLANGQTLDVGTLRLSSNVKTLNEVTVVGQAALIEEKVDRLVYNADKDIAAKGGDAADVLRKVPLLTVDLDGNVTLRGSSNIRVLINNKPSTIVASSVADALKQIPADQIKTVEVITSPSAKYDAEGSGGIINIITKKNSLQGLNLNVDGGVGNRGSLLSLNGNYRKGKMGLNLGGFGRATYNVITLSELEQTSRRTGVPNVLTRQAGDGYSSGIFGQYNLGFDYDLAKDQSITAGVKYGVRNLLIDQDFRSQVFSGSTLLNSSRRDVDIKNLSGTIDANVDYLYIIKPQQEFSISTLYSRNNLTNDFFANILGGSGELLGRQKNLNGNLNQEFTFQADYQTPIQKNQLFEVGAKSIFRRVDSDYSYFAAGPTGDFSVLNNGTAGALVYNQNIAATYLSYTYTTKKRYTIKGGLRYEHTFIDATSREAGNLGVADYGVLVPSLNASKTFKGTTVKLGANRRIQRPGLQQLNPNQNAANPQAIQVGNPNLLPELTDNVELGLSRTIKKTFVNATFFARFTDNAIVQVSQPSTVDSLKGAIVTRFENIGRQRTYGINLFSNVALTSKMNIGIFANLFYASLTGQVLNVDGSSTTLTTEGFVPGGGSFLSATFKKGWGIQGFGGLFGAQLQLQGRNGAFGFYSLGVKKESANKKYSIGLAGENFLSDRFVLRNTLNSPQFDQINTLSFYNRGIRLNFTLKLGKMTAEAPRKRAKGVNNDDVKTDGGGDGGGAPAGGAPGGRRQ